ncbi:5-cytosine rRNA methyltransferase NSUN4-like [Tubulanus polymorphus]|uniref:5-cytosine rRNA methyltransferase NSUN4-like n=1 Tax=Tubulanus polymorphus TaxID=672921 RepID=UPI003DA36265
MFRASNFAVVQAILRVPSRNRYKKKWAINRKPKEYKDVALDYFDVYHKAVFARKWPSIRLALLSLRKYTAVINNYAENETDTVTDLICAGADNMIERASTKIDAAKKKLKKVNKKDRDKNSLSNLKERQQAALENVLGENTGEYYKEFAAEDIEDDRTDVSAFVPASKVYTDAEMNELAEIEQNIYNPKDIDIEIIPQVDLNLPKFLKVFAFPRGETTQFTKPSPDQGKLYDYYLLDGASVLPVIALDLKMGDSVLDLCSGPGGKSLQILQTLTPGRLVCNDKSSKRLTRVRNVMEQYFPNTLVKETVLFMNKQGEHFDEGLEFDKVLVDVPCLTDRHILNENDNSYFKSGRTHERVMLPSLQKTLLLRALQLCKPGGSVVYSTCTLSMPQNDGVVQAALEDIWHESNIEVVVNDLKIIQYTFSDYFTFFPACRFGLLVLPQIRNNFGPMYICKLTRIK